ncbi:DUF799 domain-containing protein [Serratia microhaemolytica]|uniref:DUF799 domain-containing protein n=1 Tax=Serratia microhaemolytica TaxID=2675110 RepID=UPI000FDEFCE0|nr:DUF799 domain-containing protein [Serratia microhaemolytica]
MKHRFGALVAVALMLLSGCAKKAPYDYSAFHESKPRSILVLPPVSQSLDIKASHSVLASTSQPLAEAGYYVLPVAVVEETFMQNGLTTAGDIHAVSIEKLHQIFAADAVLYLDVVKYGTNYILLASETRVTINARLVDLRSGKLLWSGSGSASNNEGGNSNNGLLTQLIVAAVRQVVDTINDKGFEIGAVANNRLLSAGREGGILYGPRSPKYTQQY